MIIFIFYLGSSKQELKNIIYNYDDAFKFNCYYFLRRFSLWAILFSRFFFYFLRCYNFSDTSIYDKSFIFKDSIFEPVTYYFLSSNINLKWIELIKFQLIL